MANKSHRQILRILSGIVSDHSKRGRKSRVANFADIGYELGLSRTTIRSWYDRGNIPEKYRDMVADKAGIDRSELE